VLLLQNVLVASGKVAENKNHSLPSTLLCLSKKFLASLYLDGKRLKKTK